MTGRTCISADRIVCEDIYIICRRFLVYKLKTYLYYSRSQWDGARVQICQLTLCWWSSCSLKSLSTPSRLPSTARCVFYAVLVACYDWVCRSNRSIQLDHENVVTTKYAMSWFIASERQRSMGATVEMCLQSLSSDWLERRCTHSCLDGYHSLLGTHGFVEPKRLFRLDFENCV